MQGVDHYDLQKTAEFWVDDFAENPESISLEQLNQMEFRPLNGTQNFGFQDGIYWFRIEVANVDHDAIHWMLQISYSLLDRLQLFEQKDSQLESISITGDRFPFSQREVPHRQFIFDLEVPAESAKTFYLAVQTESSMQVPLKLISQTQFAQDNYLVQTALGLIYGVYFALALYNLFLYLVVRDAAFLYYVAYAFSFVALIATLNGFTFQWLWPTAVYWANLAVPILMAVALIFMTLFCRAFLILPRHSPRLNKIGLVLLLLLGISGVLALIVPYQVIVKWLTAFVFIVIAWVIGSGLIVLRRGYRPARYFLIAWAILIVGIICYASVSFGLLPKTVITEYLIQIGSGLEMILLALALAYRFNLLKLENERLAHAARDSLESAVGERTRELNAALEELATAHKQLQASSQLDGLTGVLNRRALDSALEASCRDAVKDEKELGVLVLDLDHFKEINDKHGHLAGDDCLRTVAELLSHSALQSGGIVGRYGGEEFVIILPHFDLERAQQFAESVRQDIERTRITSSDQVFSITASVGAASMRPGQGITCRQLLEAADIALYDAKDAGRNQVVTHSDYDH